MMKGLFTLILIVTAIAFVGCGDEKRPVSVFIPDGLMIDSPSGTRYDYVIIHNENDDPEFWTGGINVFGETFIELGFFAVGVARDPNAAGDVTVTWASGEVSIEDIKPGDPCVHWYITEIFPEIFRDCDNKGLARGLE